MSFILRVFLALLIIFLMEYYFFKRTTGAVTHQFPRITFSKVKKWILVSVLIINLYPALLLILWAYSAITQTGRPELPESLIFDYLILFPFWISSIIIIQSIIIFILVDSVKLALLPLYRQNKKKWLSVLSKVYLFIIAASVIYVPVRIYYDFFNVAVRIVEVDVKKDFDKSVTLTFISDIQADKYTNRERLQNYIDKVNSTDPDLVLIAGDLITSTPKYIGLAAEYLGKIRSKNGIYTCIGDHDNWAYRDNFEKSREELSKALLKQNVIMFDNENKLFNINGNELAVSFVTHTYAERVRAEVIDSLTASLPESDVKIMLSHQPGNEIIQESLEENYNLFLAGHTHGGQLSFLFPFINLSPTLIETKYVRGDFSIGNMKLIVTRGLGMSLVPIRYNSTPEITVIKIY